MPCILYPNGLRLNVADPETEEERKAIEEREERAKAAWRGAIKNGLDASKCPYLLKNETGDTSER